MVKLNILIYSLLIILIFIVIYSSMCPLHKSTFIISAEPPPAPPLPSAPPVPYF